MSALRGRSELLGGALGVGFGVLFLIPAFLARGVIEPAVGRARYRLALRVAWIGLIGGFLGLASLRAFARLETAGPVTWTLEILFSVLWFGGMISGFFAVYYSGTARKS
jgi:hypothetical protein